MTPKTRESISVRRNTIANFIGTIFQAALGFLFVPLYVRYLGIESYGLVGFAASLNAILRLTDLGLSSTLSREFARYTVLPDSAVRMRNLLKTLQAVYWGISILIGLAIIGVAPLISKYWINAGSLDNRIVQNAVMLMGLITALQGPMSLYSGGIFGLQRHVLGNSVNIIIAVFRSGGVVVALVLISPTINTFFTYQLIVALIASLSTGIILWSILPSTSISSHFHILQLKFIWKFAAGMSINSVLWLILSQLDKIILVKILPLRVFGYYAIATTAAAATAYLSGPLFTTFLPKYTQLFASGDDVQLRKIYRTSCRLNALIIIPTIILLSIFSQEALLVWTRDQVIAEQAHLFLSLLVLGYGLNQLAYLSYALQVASGWVKLGVYTNAAAVIFIVPAIVLATRFYGGIGAASVWIVLNCIYVLIFVNVLHGRVLKGEAWLWYKGMLVPLFLSLGVGLFGRWIIPNIRGIGMVCYVGLLWLLIVIVTILATSELRQAFTKFGKLRGLKRIIIYK